MLTEPAAGALPGGNSLAPKVSAIGYEGDITTVRLVIMGGE